METFIQELTSLINKHSLENVSNTPDYVLAEYVVECLEAYAKAKNEGVRKYPTLQR